MNHKSPEPNDLFGAYEPIVRELRRQLEVHVSVCKVRTTIPILLWYKNITWPWEQCEEIIETEKKKKTLNRRRH